MDISSKESIELIGCNIKTNPIIVPSKPNLNKESDINDPILDSLFNLSANKSKSIWLFELLSKFPFSIKFLIKLVR